MNPIPGSALAAEARARVLIDAQLEAAGWLVQDTKQLNLSAGAGIARREAIMGTGHGRADYLLYLDKRVAGVIEAKPIGTPLSGVEWQSAMYATGLPAEVRLSATTKDGRLPFAFEASGSETHFTNGLDPEPRARRLFNFPRPETLARILRDLADDAKNPTWRARSSTCPPCVSNRSGPRRSRRSPRSRRVWPSSVSSDHWCRWPLGRGRPTPRSPSVTGCSVTADSAASCSWSTATTWLTRRCRSSGPTGLLTTDDCSRTCTRSTSSGRQACSDRPR